MSELPDPCPCLLIGGESVGVARSATPTWDSFGVTRQLRILKATD